MSQLISRTRIVQLTDTHLFGNPDGKLMGANTNHSFLAIWESVKNPLVSPELILVTGDLTQDDSLESYQWLKAQLDTGPAPYYWLCGNHDHPELMQQTAPETMVKSVDINGWQIILLDSHIPGKIPGHLTDAELVMLDKKLSENPHLHSLVALHHPPYEINSHWLDNIHLQNAGQFLDVLSGHKNVKAVLNGHIHQEKDQLIQGVRFLATPSTCIQFKPESDDFQLDDCSPGYRELDLLADGSIETRVIRLQNYHLKLDLTSNGY